MKSALQRFFPSPATLFPSMFVFLFFIFCACYFYRLAKIVPSFLNVTTTCVPISVPSVNILPVGTKTGIIVKNVEFAGKRLMQNVFTHGDAHMKVSTEPLMFMLCHSHYISFQEVLPSLNYLAFVVDDNV